MSGVRVRACRVCGCTESSACIDEVGQPCWWIARDLCSHCAIPHPEAPQPRAEAEPNHGLRQPLGSHPAATPEQPAGGGDSP